MSFVLLQTLLSLDPASETDEHLLRLANIWNKKSVIASEQGQNIHTLDHLGFGPHPGYYENGVARHSEDRQQKLPNAFVYDPGVEPKKVSFVKTRLKIKRDGLIGGLLNSINPKYTPKIRKLLVLTRGKIRNKLHGSEVDYNDESKLQEAPKVDAVFFACSGCHQPNKNWVFPASKIGVDENRSLVNTDVSRFGPATLVMETCQIFIRKNPGNDWCLPRDDQDKVITDWEQSNDDYFKNTPQRVRDGKNGYKADMLHGIWARAPYLHNGSVPTQMHMLCPQARPEVFNRGVLFYDEDRVGFEWAVTPNRRYSQYDVMQVKQYDTHYFGRSNMGHLYGASLCPNTSNLDPIQAREEIKDRILKSKIGDLLEYLKTL